MKARNKNVERLKLQKIHNKNDTKTKGFANCFAATTHTKNMKHSYSCKPVHRWTLNILWLIYHLFVVLSLRCRGRCVTFLSFIVICCIFFVGLSVGSWLEIMTINE